MGSYKQSREKKVNKSKRITGIVLLSLSLILFLGVIMAPNFLVFKFLRGLFGLVVYPTLILLTLVGTALITSRRFSMPIKNLVYIILLSICLVGLFHTIFSTNIIKGLGASDWSNYDDYIKICSRADTNITIGGSVFAVVVYPIVMLLGLVGAYVFFAIGSVVMSSIMLDYYINAKNYKAVYSSRSVSRTYNEQANAYNYSKDTIGANISTLAGARDLIPTKTDDKEYTGYFNSDEKFIKQYDADDFNSNIDTETQEPIEKVEDEETVNPTQNAINILYGKDKFEGFETQKIAADEKANSSYDANKFSSLHEYINYQYMPKQFAENREREDEDEGDSTNSGALVNDNDNDVNSTVQTPNWFGGEFNNTRTNFKNNLDSVDDEDEEVEDENSYEDSTIKQNNLRRSNPYGFANIDEEKPKSSKYPSISDFDSEENTANTYEKRIGVRGPDLTQRKTPERQRYEESPFTSNIGNNNQEESIDSRTLERRQNAFEQNERNAMRFGSQFLVKPKAENEQIRMDVASSKPKFYGGQEKDARYIAPITSLLDNRSDNVADYGGDYKQKSQDLEQVLSSFKIDAKVSNVIRGPSVTQFELTMPFGISVRKVLGYDSDIAAALRSKSGVRIEAPIYGKNAVGVEVPNDKRSTVGLRELLESKEFTSSTAILPVAIGKNISGEVVVKSLAKMVHMLVAGSTGSGKSIFLHSLILSLMYKCSPKQLRFIMIDPKRVEFTNYSGMPHMMLPNAVTECDKAINALTWAVKEMDRRYKLFQTHSMQHIEDFNHCEAVKSGQEEFLPYIVIIIDELADLMSVGKRDVEEKIQRLAQLGRASGVHIVIATQRPSTDIITGTIKNNLPTRVAFSLGSYVDSRTILDEGGAEKLLGAGDMLLAAQDSLVTVRLQAGFMLMDEVKKVITYIKDNNESYFDEDIAKEILADKKEEAKVEDGASDNDNSNDFDELMPQALKLVIETGGASINMVQRRFRVGYARAARIIDQMELAGFVSPGNGSKLRNVYITMEQFNEMFNQGNE